MSSSTSSPQRFSGTYDSFYSDAAAAAAASGHNINSKMHVPKRIRVTGENDNSPSVNWANINKSVPEKITMQVPERIIVAGGENHIGSRGVPREFELEDSMMPRPPDPMIYRVNTPPRTITLNSYAPDHDDDVLSSPRSSTSRPPSLSGLPPSNPVSSTRPAPLSTFEEDPISPPYPVPVQSHTPSEDLPPGEEMQLLRRQVGRLNRRIMALEHDAQQRSQREMIVYCVGVAYFVMRSILWFNKS